MIDSHNRFDNKKKQEDDYVIAKPHASTWTIFFSNNGAQKLSRK